MPILIRVPSAIARRLVLLTLLYLALPLLLFFLTWLRPVWGIPISLVLGGTLAGLLFRGWRPSIGEEVPTGPQWRELAIALAWVWVPVAFMGLQIGAGGFGLGSPDWENKHDLIFADLVRSSWPVVYHGQNTTLGGLMLVYYLGYYLPPAAVGKILGWGAANIAWQLWTQFGLFLVCCWLVTFAGSRVRWLGLLFLAFSGADLIGFLLHNLDATLHLSPASGKANWHLGAIRRWNVTPSYYVFYGSNTLHLFWSPQHLLTGWLGIGLIFHRWISVAHERTPWTLWDGLYGGSALLGWCLLVFWSPLAALGCVPFLFALAWHELRVRRTKPQEERSRDSEARAITAAIIAASVLCLGVLVLYLAVRTASPGGGTPQRGEHFEVLLLSLWHEEGWHALWRYGIFVLAEFGIMCALIWPRRNEEQAGRAPLAVALVVLLVLPCFIYGYYNDLTMRVSIPAQVVLCLFVAIFLQNPNVSRVRRVGVLLLLLCGVGTLFGYVSQVADTLRHGIWNTRRPPTAFPTIVAEYANDPRHLLGQYTGPINSPFARFLAK